jgi:hypothetical protein
VSPGSQINGLKPLFKKIINGQFWAQGCIGFDLHTQIRDELDLLIQDPSGKAVLGNADAQHTARLRKGFENGGTNTFAGQMISSGKPCWARANDANRLLPSWQARNLNVTRIKFIGCESFEIPDSHRIIHLASAAGILATVRANPPKDAGQGEILHDNVEGLFVFTLANHLHVRLHVEACGAG